MNTRARISAVMAALVCLGATGCMSTASPAPAPMVTARPVSPTATPTPTQREIIGQRAAGFFAEYRAILADPTKPVEDMAKYGRGPALEAYVKGLQQVRAKNFRAIGPEFRFYDIQVGIPGEGDEGRSRVPVSLCVDSTGNDLIDTNGNSVREPGLPDILSKDVWLEEWPDGWFVMGEADGTQAC